MPSRREFLRRSGGAAVAVGVVGSAAHLDVGFVRTKLGGSFDSGIVLESQDDEAFVPPAEFGSYADRTREQYGDAGLPWTNPGSLDGEFVGAYARQVDVVPDSRYAVQDAAVLVHRLGDARYRLRLWSAGRLLGRSYHVDPWSLYRERPGFTWLEQVIEADGDDQLSADRALSTGGGRVDVAGATVTVPDGSYETGLADDARYRSRWDGFHRGTVALVGTCEASFADGEERRLDWTLSNGVGVRTPL